jgi:hypothetical protein
MKHRRITPTLSSYPDDRVARVTPARHIASIEPMTHQEMVRVAGETAITVLPSRSWIVRFFRAFRRLRPW